MDPQKSFLQLIDLSLCESALARGNSVLVGLSGGADSVALLHAMSEFSKSTFIKIAAVHVNHGLRPEAETEQEFVMELCDELNVPCMVRRLIPEKKPAQTSPEQYWRQLRYNLFTAVMKESNSDYLALGHTADDLAETFLYHLARGTGIDGLVFNFANKIDSLQIIRPLWHTERGQIEDALSAANQKWVNDPSNSDVRFSRNLLRSQVIPVLKQINPSVVQAIGRLSAHIQELADRGVESSSNQDTLSGQSCQLQFSSHSEVPHLAQQVRSFVRSVSGIIMDRRQTAQAVRMISTQRTGTVALRGKHTLVITQTGAWVYPGDQPCARELAKHHVLLFGGLFADLPERTVSSPAELTALDGSTWSVSWTEDRKFIIRNPAQGDRVGAKPLSRLFIDFKLPWYLREFTVLLTEHGRILFAPGCGSDINNRITRRNSLRLDVRCTKSKASA